MSNPDEYVPQIGHHVRVTKDGVIDDVVPYEEDQYTVSIDGLRYTTGPRYGHVLTRLPDPEPKWVEGDLIVVDDTSRLLRGWDLKAGSNAWRNIFGEVVDDEHVSNAWREGRVTILYQAVAS